MPRASGPAAVDLSVVVVSYNVKPYLEQALLSIRKALKGIRAEVFVVDNASGDGSAAMVRSRFPEAVCIANAENVGFARANNQALRAGTGRAVCLVNPDTLVREDTFRTCLRYLDGHPEAGVVGCKVLNPDGSLQPACRRSFPTPWVALAKISGLSALFPRSRWFGRYNLTYLDPDAVSEVEAVSGSFMLVRREVLDTVGLLDESFFLYGEDLDWCYRIHRRGWKIIYLPETQIVHYKGRSAREAPFDTLREFDRAMHLFVRKHFRRGWAFFPMWLLRAGIWARTAVGALLRAGGRLAVPAFDAAVMQAALPLALWLRFGSVGHWGSYRVVYPLYTLGWLLALSATGCYRKGVFSTSRALGGTLIGLVVNASATFFLPQYAFSRHVVLVSGLINGVLLGGWRLALRVLPRFTRFPFLGTVGRTLMRRRAAVVGTGPEAVRVYERLRHRIESGLELVGLFALDEAALAAAGSGHPPRLGLLDDLPRLARTLRLHTVVFSPEASDFRRIVGAIAAARDARLDFKLVPRDLDVIIGSSSIDSLADVPLVDLDYRLYRPANRVFKRIMDVTAVACLAPALLPARVFIALHPAYRLRRVDILGASGGPEAVPELLRNGEKAAGILRWVPLFGAVLAGRLSLVGLDIRPWSRRARPPAFKPGLTGLVQINLRKGLNEDEKERYRLYYLKNYSYLLDLEILLKAAFRL